MATHQYGRDYRIKVGDGGGPEAFNTIGGEGTWDDKRSNDQIDFSSKDDGNYKSMGWGQQAVTISVQGKVKLPDTGFLRVHSVSKSQPPELTVQIVKTTDNTVIYQGKMGVGNLTKSAPQGGAMTFSFDFVACEAPTIDDLSGIA